MDFIAFFKEYWWVVFLLIPLAYVYFKLQAKKSFGGLKLKDMAVLFETIGFILLIYLMQVYLFPDVWQFSAGFPLFVVIWVLAIDKLLEKQNKYVMTVSVMGEKHYNIEDMEIKYSASSQCKMLVMDTSVYNEKKHVGEADYSFWNGSPNIKFADYYDEKTGTFFHPELPQFHNVSIYIARPFLLKMKEDMPELYRKNIMLTWLHNYRVGYEQEILKDKFFMHLGTIDKQIAHKPFALPMSIKDMHDDYFREQQKIALDTEKLEHPEPKKEDKKEGEKSSDE